MNILENAIHQPCGRRPHRYPPIYIYPPIDSHILTIPIIQLTYIPHSCPEPKCCIFYIICTCIICTCSIFYIAISFLISLGPEFSRNKGLFWYFEKSCICVFVYLYFVSWQLRTPYLTSLYHNSWMGGWVEESW